jgi:glycosyltransferase involved in cell wall biosynthesis
MRIGINGYQAARGVGGIARHSRVLLRALLETAPEHEYVVFSDRALPRDLQLHPGIVSRVLPVRPYTAWEQAAVPVAAARERLDVFWGPGYGLPLLLGARMPATATIQDLSFRRVPGTLPRKAMGYYKLFVKPSLRRARRVIVPSHATACDLRGLLGIPRERIDVVPNAVGPEFRPVVDAAVLASLHERYELPERFILYTGTIEPRKNLARLIDAYSRARTAHGVTEPLILAGSLGWLYREILELPARLGIERHVRRLGFVPDQDLPALFSAAALFVYPSLYEGFGLPPLEAMACGTPVVASSAPALPEVVGEAAVLVEPSDVDGLADALARALRDAPLRSALRAAGYSTRALGSRTLQCFERARCG